MALPGGGELLIVLVIVLVLFGGAKLPQLARSIGQAQRELRRGSDDEPTGVHDAATKSDQRTG